MIRFRQRRTHSLSTPFVGMVILPLVALLFWLSSSSSSSSTCANGRIGTTIVAWALSSSSSLDTLRQQRANRLAQALSSPSGKMTYSPELALGEKPLDWTAIALEANAVQGLSKTLRDAKANAIVLQGSLTALQTCALEQETVLGRFPGPVPIIYCWTTTTTTTNDDDDDETPLQDQLLEISNAGADGLLVSVEVDDAWTTTSTLLSTSTSMSTTAPWVQVCQSALDCGLQPIPELLVPTSMTGSNNHKAASVSQWVDQVCTLLGFDPVALLLTIRNNHHHHNNNDDSNDAEPPEEEGSIHPPDLSVATLPYYCPQQDSNSDNDVTSTTTTTTTSQRKRIKTRMPLLASIQRPTGEGRLQAESTRLKDEAGYLAGAVLRRQCLPPGLQLSSTSNNNHQKQYATILELWGPFWASCLNDLKSTRSKSFSFRAKNQMEKSVATQWGNYQKSILESGALGDPKESHSVVDEAAGDYKGFA
ncbi:hypothetical protein ACA910_005628 [Epithemia clementina (nom. ined.)]